MTVRMLLMEFMMLCVSAGSLKNVLSGYTCIVWLD